MPEVCSKSFEYLINKAAKSPNQSFASCAQRAASPDPRARGGGRPSAADCPLDCSAPRGSSPSLGQCIASRSPIGPARPWCRGPAAEAALQTPRAGKRVKTKHAPFSVSSLQSASLGRPVGPSLQPARVFVKCVCVSVCVVLAGHRDVMAHSVPLLLSPSYVDCICMSMSRHTAI